MRAEQLQRFSKLKKLTDPTIKDQLKIMNEATEMDLLNGKNQTYNMKIGFMEHKKHCKERIRIGG